MREASLIFCSGVLPDSISMVTLKNSSSLSPFPIREVSRLKKRDFISSLVIKRLESKHASLILCKIAFFSLVVISIDVSHFMCGIVIPMISDASTVLS